MKKLVLSFAFILSAMAMLSAQEANRVIGFWLTENGKSQVKVFKATDGMYYGKIIWLNKPLREDGTPKIDDKNPDPALQTRPLIGLQLLSGFKYDEKKKEWNQGKIYDPESGNTYKCYMWFENGNYNELHIKGYIGISLIGRESVWIKETQERK